MCIMKYHVELSSGDSFQALLSIPLKQLRRTDECEFPLCPVDTQYPLSTQPFMTSYKHQQTLRSNISSSNRSSLNGSSDQWVIGDAPGLPAKDCDVSSQAV